MAAVTQSIRLKQLEALEAAIGDLIQALRRTEQYVDAIPMLEECKQASFTLRQNGFDQRNLNDLANAVPRLFYLHPRWEPPYTKIGGDRWEEPAWFRELEPLERRVDKLAFNLRVIGEY